MSGLTIGRLARAAGVGVETVRYYQRRGLLRKLLRSYGTTRRYKTADMILCGGEALKLPGRLAGGWFIAPAVIEGLANDCRTNQEEIFGPVATLIPFEGENEALALANDVRYGLAASLWTENLGKALRVSERLQAGLIWVNCWMLRDLRTPMGGVKDYGLGHEGGFESKRFFTETGNLCLKY